MIHPHLPAGCQTRTPEQRLTRPVSRFRKLGWQLPAISHPPHRVCTVCVYIWNGEFFSAPVCSIIVLLCFTILLCIMPIESWIEYISIALHYIHTCIYVHIRAYTYIYVHIRTFSLLLLFWTARLYRNGEMTMCVFHSIPGDGSEIRVALGPSCYMALSALLVLNHPHTYHVWNQIWPTYSLYINYIYINYIYNVYIYILL